MKENLLLLFGGETTEHEISMISAKHVFKYLDKELYDILLIYIDKTGEWRRVDPDFLTKLDNHPDKINVSFDRKSKSLLAYVDCQPCLLLLNEEKIMKTIPIHCAIPMLHGTNGEDGAIQGLFELYHVPYVGNTKESSVVCMDKELTKRLLDYAKVPIVPFVTLKKNDVVNYSAISNKLKTKELFVKTTRLGSSVGVYKTRNEEEFVHSVKKAFGYENKIIVEKAMAAREIEVAVLEYDGTWIVSQPGEVVPKHEFYDYSAKYLDDKGAVLKCPAELEVEEVIKIQTLAKEVIDVLEIRGMARIDLFYDGGGKLFVNEVNGIPGFTPISMYPKLMDISGVPYQDLIKQLIREGKKKIKEREKLSGR